MKKYILIIISVLSFRNTHCDLKSDLRKLWTDHTVYTRLYIISALANLADLKAVEARLMKNQEDIGNAICKLDKNIGVELTKLLKEHIAIAGEIVKAAKEKNNAKVKELDQKWHKNADDIAELLSVLLPKETLQKHLYDHLKLTADELKLRLGKKWPADIKNYDKIYEQILGLSDALSEAIEKKFAVH